MITQQAQIKLNLPAALKDFAESRAQRFGMPLAGYIRHLILKDVEVEDFPVFQASDEVEKATKKALKELGKAVDAEVFFESLNNEG